MQQSDIEIKDFLELKVKAFNNQEYLKTDPLQIPHRYSNKKDMEISAFLTSQLAWGNRKAIIKSATTMLEAMGESPSEWLTEVKNHDLEVFDGFVYRTFNSLDLKYYAKQLGIILREYESLGNYFNSLYISGGSDVKMMLSLFYASFMNKAPQRTARHLANVDKNSAAKRLNMFLRWMVRSDSMKVDLGIWKFIPQSELYIPLDVHSGRVSRKLGLLDRNADDWKSVEILTSKLRQFDPSDPVKYDYALFGLGVFEGF
jgi:uncharacterized protein (TIGR02757 family)